MLTYLLTTALAALAAIVVIGLALLPLALMSGLWAALGARSHREQAQDIERILAQDERSAQS